MTLAKLLELWPVSQRQHISEIFTGIEVHANGPTLGAKVSDNCICVFDQAPVAEVLRQMGFGYAHVVQQKRPDFPYSMLSGALMIKQPDAFLKDPAQFIFSSFDDGLKNQNPSILDLVWTAPWNKVHLIDQAVRHIASVPQARPYRDFVGQSLDELLSNAKPKDNKIVRLPVRIGVNQDRLCIAVHDAETDFDIKHIRQRLWHVSRQKQWSPSSSAGGSGLGLPIVINNSTSFYLCRASDGGGVSVSVIDIQVGLRDLEQTPKNVHMWGRS